MSWSDIYPILNEEQLEEYRAGRTVEEERRLEELFGIREVFNQRATGHVVAVSLFWKNVRDSHGDLPPITRDLMFHAEKYGLVTRYHPWWHYVEPLMEGSRTLRRLRPDMVFRVYLAGDLEFLVPELVEAGCEVRLMKGNSIRHNPGALWRFLALEESCLVTVTDADRAVSVMEDVARTELIMNHGLGFWRVPYLARPSHRGFPGYYRPIVACHFGAVGGYPMGELLRAFMWHTFRGSMPDSCTQAPGDGEIGQREIYGTDWPNYGFDEWFLIAAVYPRIVAAGVITFLPDGLEEYSKWLIRDIEYVMWANKDSEVVFYTEQPAAAADHLISIP